MSSGNYREALAVSKTLHPGPDRENIERIIHREWGFDRRQRIGSDLLSGKETEALRILQNIQEKDPAEYRNILVELDPDQRSHFYSALIQDGQERLAIRTIDTLYADRKTAYDPILSFAYSHWAVRRLEEKRYRNALYFARKSRRADPHNRTARKVILRVSRMRDRLVNRGLLAYRHQQVQKAIDLWNRALLFDPSNPDIKRYILEARSILEKISVLKKSPVGPHP